MIQDRYWIADEYRETSIEILLDNLASLRARIGITQEELANVIGISRQTYYALETRKREMSWPIYLAIVFFFDCLESTSEMIRELRIYPIDLVMRFNNKISLAAVDNYLAAHEDGGENE